MRKMTFCLSASILVSLLLSCGENSSSQSASSSIKPKEVVDVVLSHAPTKTKYKEGEYFSKSGLVLEAHYDDGSIQAVHGYSIDPAGPLSTSDDAIMVSYDAFDVMVPIVVSSSGSSVEESDESSESSFRWGELNEDYEEEILGSASTYVQPAGEDHPANDIHSDLQYRYLSSGYNTITSFASGTKEASKNRGLLLEIDEPAEEGKTRFIEVSEDKSFAVSRVFEFEGDEFYYPNPFLDQNYYYRFASDKGELSNASIEHAYSLDLMPRNLTIDGITNVRDIGGYASKLGGVIRQGLYYRGGRLNVSETNTFKLDITEEGLVDLIDNVGIRTEIDLRMNDSGLFPSYSNEFGFMNDEVIPEIDYVNCPLDWTQSDMMKQSKPMIAEIFGYLADEANYPVYLHCNIGTDRTGMITYLLGTLLGIPQEDLYRDYLFSNFGNIGSSRGVSNITSKYQVDLLSYQKENLYLDARAYLSDCGVSDEEMDNIVNLFLDFDAI